MGFGLVAIAVLAVAVTLGVVGSPVELMADRPAQNDAVDLPDVSTGATSDPDADEVPPPAAPVDVDDLPTFGCRPDGCALWHAPLQDGASTVVAGRIYQATASGVRSIDAATGRTLWRRPHDEAGLPTVLDGVGVRVVDDEVVVTSDGGLLQVRASDTGDLRWHADLEVARVTGLAVHGEVLIAVGSPRAGEGQPPVAITAYDRRTGAPRWEQAVHRTVAIDADPLVLQPQTLAVVAVDPLTGETLWTRDVIGPVRGLTGDGALALVSPGGVDLLDPRTGETLRTVPRRVSDGGVTRIVGGLLIVDAPSGPDPQASPRSHVTVLTLHGPQRPTLEIPGTTAVLEVGDGVVVASHDDDTLTLQRITSTGDRPWVRNSDLAEPTCCWTLEAGPHRTTALVVPPEPGRTPVEVLDLNNARLVTTFTVPTTQTRNTLTWIGGIGVEADADGTVLTGHGGTVRLVAGAEVVAVDPVPIVHVPGGLIGLDRDVLLPPRERR